MRDSREKGAGMRDQDPPPPPLPDPAHWKLNDGGYSLHVLNCLEECITCFILAFYQISYHKDCQTFSIEVCCVENNGKKFINLTTSFTNANR